MANSLFGVAQALANRLFPTRNSPSGLRFRFPFASMGVTEYSYQLQLQPAKLEWITGAFIDNSRNTEQFMLVIGETGQRVTIPAHSQGAIELLGLITDKVSIYGTTTGNIDVEITFLNYVPPSANAIWSVIDPGTVVGAITVNGQVTTTPLVGSFSAPTVNAIIAGGTSQLLFGAAASRRRIIVYNPATNVGQGIVSSPEILWINFGAPAAPDNGTSFEILPGGVFDSGQGPVTNQAINIVAATTGHQFVAKQM